MSDNGRRPRMPMPGARIVNTRSDAREIAAMKHDIDRLQRNLAATDDALEEETRDLAAARAEAEALREEVAASRERERAERERADRLWQECENLRLRLPDVQQRRVVDKAGDSQGRVVDKASNLQDRMARCIGCGGFYLRTAGHACAHTTIPPEDAAPDSAASPTGGEG